MDAQQQELDDLKDKHDQLADVVDTDIDGRIKSTEAGLEMLTLSTAMETLKSDVSEEAVDRRLTGLELSVEPVPALVTKVESLESAMEKERAALQPVHLERKAKSELAVVNLAVTKLNELKEGIKYNLFERADPLGNSQTATDFASLHGQFSDMEVTRAPVLLRIAQFYLRM